MAHHIVVTPERLAHVGRALYGERWQTSLAMDLHVAGRTVRRWLAGDAPIPININDQLTLVLKRRIHELSTIAMDVGGRNGAAGDLRKGHNIVDMISMPESDLIDFEPERLQGPISRPADLC